MRIVIDGLQATATPPEGTYDLPAGAQVKLEAPFAGSYPPNGWPVSSLGAPVMQFLTFVAGSAATVEVTA